MNSLEYLNENGLRKYPFVDGASLVPTNGINIPGDLFVDAGLYPLTGQTRIRLTTIEKSVSAIRIYFESVIDASVVALPVISFQIVDVEPLLRNTFSVTGLSGFITFGKGLSTCPNNTYLFTDGSCFVVDSRILPISPKVTTVTSSNFNIGGTTTVVGSSSTEVVMEEGSNIQFQSNQVSVVPRAGTGLYNPCADDVFVKSVNGVGTQNGNFLFTTDACERVAYPDPYGLFIENLCTAGCSAEAIEASAYYINRVNNGLAQMGGIIKDLRDNLNAEIENYIDVTIPARETPYTIPTLAKFGNGSPSTGLKTNYTYFTMRMYVYNPSVDTITVTAAGTIGPLSTLVSCVYLDKNGETIPTTIPSSPPGFCGSTTTDCRSFTIGCKEFVVVKLTTRVLNPPFGSSVSSIAIDTTVGSKTYSVKTGL